VDLLGAIENEPRGGGVDPFSRPRKRLVLAVVHRALKEAPRGVGKVDDKKVESAGSRGSYKTFFLQQRKASKEGGGGENSAADSNS